MKIILPKTKQKKILLEVGDILHSKNFDDVYIFTKLPDHRWAWFNPFKGTCANGVFDSIHVLRSRSEQYLENTRDYEIFKSDRYNLKLVNKEIN